MNAKKPTTFSSLFVKLPYHYKYKLIKKHSCKLPPKLEITETVTVCDQIGNTMASVRANVHELELHAGYQWNGSNIVPDIASCMEASAVHDALCQFMELDLVPRHKKNWKCAARLYRDICRKAGMSKWRSSIRYWFIVWFGF